MSRFPLLATSALALLLPLSPPSWLFGQAEPFSFSSIEASDPGQIEPPLRSPWTLEYRFRGALSESSFLDEVRITTLGNVAAVRDYLFLLHGDTPSYYDSSTSAGRSALPMEAELWTLHKKLSAAGEGLVVIQPKASSRDWHSLYGSTPDDPRGPRLVGELADLYRRCREPFSGESRWHLHSFSGAGRVDRAFHEVFLHESPDDSSARALRVEDLKSWTASDAMVNNSFSTEEKVRQRSVLAVSWARFHHRFPGVSITLVYDRSGEYRYMQGVNLDVLRFSHDLETRGEIASAPSVALREQGGTWRTVNVDDARVLRSLKSNEGRKGTLKLTSADSHLGSFLGRIAESWLDHRSLLRSTP